MNTNLVIQGCNSGIYRIYNIQNGKSYIGQTKDIKQRIRTHFNQLDSGNHIVPEMQNDYTNNPNSSDYEILEEIPRWKHDKMLLAEGQWIEKYNSYHKGYNQTQGRTEPPMVLHRIKVSKEKASKLFLEKYIGNA
ncbi:MAG: GIY-YIG nuclease family protein [Lachnospiraceae bacterium]